MGEPELRDAARQLENLAKEVLEHRETLNPVTIEAYQPQGLTPRFLTVSQSYISKEIGFAFGGDHPGHSGLLVENARGDIAIATRFEFPHRLRRYYAIHTPYDYVNVWLNAHRIPTGEAKEAIDEVVFQIEQLLPVRHPRRRESIEQGCRHHVYR